jgi:hypothetical protein
MGATATDLARDGWFAGVIVAGAFAAEMTLAKPRDPSPGEVSVHLSLVAQGITPAIVYLAAACAWVWQLGWWAGAPR